MNEIIIQDEKGQTIAEYDQKMVETIKQTVAKDATDEELYMFLNVANMYGLNPFTKEIWFVKDPKNPKMGTAIMTSRDGYVKIAKQNPKFGKLQSNAIYENDEFEMIWEGMDIKSLTHKHAASDRGKVVGAWAGIRSKDGEDTYVYAPFREYNKGTTFWKYASAMIRKVAEKEVCRLFSNVSGIYIPEEMDSKKYDLKNSQREDVKKETESKEIESKETEPPIIDVTPESANIHDDPEQIITKLCEDLKEDGKVCRKSNLIKLAKEEGCIEEVREYIKNLTNEELKEKYEEE